MSDGVASFVRGLRAVAWMVPDGVRRLLRETMVVRSLTFPSALTAAVIVGTVFALVLYRPPAVLAVTPEAAVPELLQEADAGGWPVLEVADPEAAVHEGYAAVGTDGETVWTHKGGTEVMRLDGIVRRAHGAGWVPVMTSDRALRSRGHRGARNLLQLLGALFAFYGVVFGAGSVARDRDQGTLEVELALPVPLWVHGAARWLSSTLVLSAWWAFTILLFHALLGAEEPWALLRHGVAASSTSVAIGLMVIGRGGLARGFAGPLSAGLVAVVSLLSYGVSTKGADQYVPIASMLSSGASGWTSLGVATLIGLGGVALFTWRGTVD